MLHKNKEYFSSPTKTSIEVKKEITEGFKILNSIDRPLVTIFGSHITPKSHADYKHAYRLGKTLAKKGYAVATGGGPGIMEAANRGAFDAGAPSVGLRAALLKQEVVDGNCHTHDMGFVFMFVRRFMLSIKSEALIFYPGGYGTLNELFEFTVLIQTGMTDKVPLILVNKDFWKGMQSWLTKGKNTFYHDAKKDFGLLSSADTVQDVMRLLPAIE
ncbi:Rossman fold protein, TIGR00730 family [Candidatus Woesearchaeota archaeon CG1_02_57_44]|nr:MAG: Rossman fold protein, TIGR00730 family [Candidatus Woesearchaeota archaeon CG1_02_57_44]